MVTGPRPEAGAVEARMIEEAITFVLPQPWAGETFEIDEVGPVNYLVGPNGSGKSRFAAIRPSAVSPNGRHAARRRSRPSVTG